MECVDSSVNYFNKLTTNQWKFAPQACFFFAIILNFFANRKISNMKGELIITIITCTQNWNFFANRSRTGAVKNYSRGDISVAPSKCIYTICAILYFLTNRNIPFRLCNLKIT